MPLVASVPAPSRPALPVLGGVTAPPAASTYPFATSGGRPPPFHVAAGVAVAAPPLRVNATAAPSVGPHAAFDWTEIDHSPAAFAVAVPQLLPAIMASTLSPDFKPLP